MPDKPKKPCKWPGCPELTYGSYCKEHEKKVDKNYEKTRETAVKRGYDTRWRRLRKVILARDPVCVSCGRKAANEVHHIDGDSQNNDMDNLQALCKPCHSRKTAKEQGRWVRK